MQEWQTKHIKIDSKFIQMQNIPFEKLDYRLSSNDKEVQDGYLDASEMGAYWEYLDTYDADGRSGKISK